MRPAATAAQPEARLGALLQKTYRLDRVLGVGGMGIVYEAQHIHLQRSVAVKVLHSHVAELRVPLERFRREAQIASQLGHPGLVSVIDFNFTEDGAPYMVMELLDGETLTQRLARGPLTLAEGCRLFDQLCDALHAVHEAGVIHRDLKPDNIFLLRAAVDGARQVKILDFGISKIQDTIYDLRNSQVTDQDELTGHEVLGTPCYLAPEQAAGEAHEVDRRADIFALGTILYECLTGQRAFDGPHAVAILRMMMSQPMPRARDRLPELPPAVDEVIARACAKDAAARFPTAQALNMALAESAGPPDPPVEAAAWGGDGDTLFDAQVESLRAAASEAYAAPPAAAPPPAPEPTPTAIEVPPHRVPATQEMTMADDSLTVEAPRPAVLASGGLPTRRPVDRPTALLDTVPIPAPTQPPGRWAQGHDATVDVKSVPAPVAEPQRGWMVTLTTAVLAVILGVLVGMMVLKLMSRDRSPSLALERAQQTQQLLSDGEQLAAQGRCDDAVRRASAVLMIERENARARQILKVCQRQ